MPTHQSIVIKSGEGPDGETILTLDADGIKDAGGNPVDFKEHVAFHHLHASGVALLNSAHLWVAPGKYQVSSIKEKHTLSGGASSTFQFSICQNGMNPSSGTLITPATTVSGALNTVQSFTLSNSLVMNDGDSLALITGGTLTGYVGAVSVAIKRMA